jgi:serine/threonine protein kinase
VLLKVVRGCLHLKSKQIVHRDIKPSNIFFKNSEPILADLGFATNINNDRLMKLNAGSPLYMPYESLANRVFS